MTNYREILRLSSLGLNKAQMKKPTGSKAVYVLDYDECRKVINEMKFVSDSELFGNEKDDSFKGSIPVPGGYLSL